MMDINNYYIPDDAEEYKEDIIDIYNHIPDGWGRWISCGPGWYKTIVETHNKLKFIDPNYEVHQIKEKFGGLRYYIHSNTHEYGSMQERIMEDIINAAEQYCSNICEDCGGGSDVKNRAVNYYYQTQCIDCAINRGHEPNEEEKEYLKLREEWKKKTATQQG
jgi:hypothetical protein